MSKLAVGLLISVVAAGNILTIALLLDRGDSGTAGNGADVAREIDPAAPLLEAMDALRADVDTLRDELRLRPSAAAAAEPDAGFAGGTSMALVETALAARFDDLTLRLERLETMLVAMKDLEAELAAAKLREKREEQFRAEDGFALADELLAQNQFAVGANGILTFLDAHPDHPDARDLMKKARDAFAKAGYGEKALWLQGEIMGKFPERRGEDLYALAMLEKQSRNYDDAIRHMDESLELAPTDQDRMHRLFYRAYLIHQRDGDAAGLDVYREVERLAGAAGIDEPARVAAQRAGEIEKRLARK
jgi:tetratricopeptide (TPR) repeat protein